MNYLEQQKYRKNQTRKLLVSFTFSLFVFIALLNFTFLYLIPPLFIFRTINITGYMVMIMSVVIAVALFISTLIKLTKLRRGGDNVAEDIGGTPISSSSRSLRDKRLLNIVEEISIAAGMPTPRTYILKNENGINAFVAGTNPSNAIIAVTQGAVEKLERDEMQGLLAHEFSHISNGDMKLNNTLMALVHGMLVFSQAGKKIMEMITKGMNKTHILSMFLAGFVFLIWYVALFFIKPAPPMYEGYPQEFVQTEISGFMFGAPQIFAVGAAIFIFASIGLYLSRFIKSNISKQREFLADATAVEYTRQTHGIKTALLKIAARDDGSILKNKNTEEVSHMLFAKGQSNLANLLNTHPPVQDRIYKLEPLTNKVDVLVQIEKMRTQAFKDDIHTQEIKKSQKTTLDPLAGALGGLSTILSPVILDALANPSHQHIQYANSLHKQIPKSLLTAAHATDGSIFNLIYALHLHNDDKLRTAQLSTLIKVLGENNTNEISSLFAGVQSVGDKVRLPLIEIAFPTLKQLKPTQIEFMLDTLDNCIESASITEPLEYALSRVLRSYLRDAGLIKKASSHTPKATDYLTALKNLFAMLSYEGSHCNTRNEDAFNKGVLHFIEHPDVGVIRQSFEQQEIDKQTKYAPLGEQWTMIVDDALLVLDHCKPKLKVALIEALSITIGFDNEVSQTESELLRAICSTLHCPMPPILKT